MKRICKVPNYYGWDIGGAHVKLCQIKSKKNKDIIRATHLKCKLWMGLKHLDKIIKKLENDWHFNENDLHFFTMSGEMVDCFPNRKDGIKNILKILKKIFGPKIKFYSQESLLIKASSIHNWQSIASANWHATASFISSHIKEGILIDVGSTTTDIIPIKNNMPLTDVNTSDAKRLQKGELVYLGVTRTPVSSIKPFLSFRNRSYNVMRESFANTADVFRITGEISNKIDLYPTCDKKKKSTPASERRLARVIGMDREDASSEEWKTFANNIKKAIIEELHQNICKIKKKLNLCAQTPLIVTGSGAFLAKQLSMEKNYSIFKFHELVQKKIELHNSQIEEINICAPAVSLALIAKNK